MVTQLNRTAHSSAFFAQLRGSRTIRHRFHSQLRYKRAGTRPHNPAQRPSSHRHPASHRPPARPSTPRRYLRDGRRDAVLPRGRSLRSSLSGRLGSGRSSFRSLLRPAISHQLTLPLGRRHLRSTAPCAARTSVRSPRHRKCPRRWLPWLPALCRPRQASLGLIRPSRAPPGPAMPFTTQSPASGEQYVLTASLDNARNLSSLLRAVHFQDHATCFATANGLRVTVEDAKCIQANAFIQVGATGWAVSGEAVVNGEKGLAAVLWTWKLKLCGRIDVHKFTCGEGEALVQSWNCCRSWCEEDAVIRMWPLTELCNVWRWNLTDHLVPNPAEDRS